MTKLDCHNVSVSVRPVDFDCNEDRGRVPDNLAALTETIVALHRANGDLSWLRDMISEEPDVFGNPADLPAVD